MASILTPSAFQIKIKEEHVVKGVKTLNETYFTLGNITNVDRRIVTIPAQTPIDLFNVNGVNPSNGTFPSSSMKYARITNLDTTSSLAVSFTSSRSPDGIGIVGTDLTSSYTSGGTGGVTGLYPAVPTTSSVSGSGMTLDVDISSSLILNQSLTISANITDGATGAYTVPLSGGTGINATGSVVVTGVDPTAPTVSTIVVSGSGRGYLVGDTLTVAAGLLGTGQLITGDVLPNTTTPTVTNDITREIAVYTSTGQGATVDVVSSGGSITTVTVKNIGTGYVDAQVITITDAQLTNVGFGTVSSDYTSTLTPSNVQDSSVVTITPLTDANIATGVFEASIVNGGTGYQVGETVTVNKAEIGNTTEDAIFTLTLNDFTENGARSYWTMDVLPTSSLMFSSPQVTGSHFNGFFGQDLEFVSVYAETERMDIEYVVVNSDNV